MFENRHLTRRPCDGIPRRELLRVGGLTALGVGLADVLRSRRAQAAGGSADTGLARAKNCILIWLDGGPSHLETFDPKPQAPAEVRGPFEPIATAVPGVQFAEHLPELARRMDRLTVIRSMTSPLGEHNFGTHYLLTGYKPTPVLEHAFFGSVVTHLREARNALPANIAVPDFRVGGSQFRGNGFLPAATQPFSLGGDPARNDFEVRDLEFYQGVTPGRLERRRDFLHALDRFHGAGETTHDPDFEQAYRLVTSSEARDAFRLEDEPASVRQRYGFKTVGQSCLLARRLVERGVPFVTVNHRGWDTHADLVTRLRDGYTGAVKPVGLVPSLDRACAALIDDLQERGLLQETLIAVMGEFGRTPKLNTQGGRDHWPRVFSVALAGGGVPGGQVVGRSDAVGESRAERPVTPSDLAATIYTLLGIDPGRELHTADGRPVQIVQEGIPLLELVG